MDYQSSIELARDVACAIVAMNEQDRVELFHNLRRNKRLSSTVHSLNRLAAHPDHGRLGLDALASLGLATRV